MYKRQLHISGTAEARNFKFGTQIDHNEKYPRNAKLGQTGTQARPRDLLLNVGTDSISLERLKLETSNLVRGLSSRSSIQKNAKSGQMST